MPRQLLLATVIAAALASALSAQTPTIKPLAATELKACLGRGELTWSFTANWEAVALGGKVWPTYVVEPKGCTSAVTIDCRGDARCSAHFTCSYKARGATVWVEPAPHGTGRRATTGGAVKPPTCKP